jgi:signal transduction histidine kinase
MGEAVERPGYGEPKPGRAEAVATTLAALQGTGERAEELAHDARNMVTALELYCELLDEPGVLAPRFRHYGDELRLVVAASRRLVDKLAALDPADGVTPAWAASAGSAMTIRAGPVRRSIGASGRSPETGPRETPVANLAAELETKRNLLAALAGPGVALEMRVQGGAHPAWLTREDLTRILVNLVKNAVEAAGDRGRIAIGLDEFHAPAGSVWLVLTVEDDGPGIAGAAPEEIFASGFTTHTESGRVENGRGLRTRRGLGLSITQSIVEAAGGRISAANRRGGGARIAIELPVRTP